AMKKMLLLLLVSGNALAERATVQSLSGRYLEGLFAAKPHLATFMGDHRFDGKLPDYSSKALAAREKELVSLGKDLKSVPAPTLDARIDKQIMEDGIALELLY